MLTILKFSAKGCAPCAQLSKMIDQNKDLLDKVIIEDVDYEQHPDLFRQYNVKAVPTIVLIGEEGRELDRKDKCSWYDLLKMTGLSNWH